MDLTLKQLRAFVTVADLGQITRAAERLGLTQSAVSTLIRQLEENLELRLFDRHTRLLRLTEAGAEILPVARRAVADIDAILENSRELGMLRRGRVSIAAGTLQAALLLPRRIGGFRERFPNIEISLHDVSEEAVFDLVRNGAVDLGIGTAPVEDPELGGTRLTTDVFQVAMRKDDPLALRKNLAWRDLADATLIGPQPGNPVRDRLDTELGRKGVMLKIHKAVRDVTLPLTNLGMVEAGMGVVIVTAAVEPLAQAMGLVCVTPGDPLISRDISVITKRDRTLSPAARRFHDYLLRPQRPAG